MLGKEDKKLYISIGLTMIVLVFGILFAEKTEAPTYKEKFFVQEINAFIDHDALIPNTPLIPLSKYKVANRSIIIPENTTNKEKTVLLTIDDGPSSRTLEMINILKKHNAKAIFFINGIKDKNNKGIITAIENEGFAVGNHTWSHINLKKEKDINISKTEIIKTTELIKENTGKYPRFFRAPYGESNALIREFVKDNGMIFMDWSGSVMDWDKSTIEKDVFVGNVMKNIHPGSILLIHEHPWSVANLDALLTDIEAKGYSYIDPNDIVE